MQSVTRRARETHLSCFKLLRQLSYRRLVAIHGGSVSLVDNTTKQGSVAHGLSEFYLALQILDFPACGGRDGMEIEGYLFDLASECVWRLVVRADRRTGIHADVECFVGR